MRCGIGLREVSRLAHVRYWPLYRVYRQERVSFDLEHAEAVRVLELWSVTTHRPVDQAPMLSVCNRF